MNKIKTVKEQEQENLRKSQEPEYISYLEKMERKNKNSVLFWNFLLILIGIVSVGAAVLFFGIFVSLSIFAGVAAFIVVFKDAIAYVFEAILEMIFSSF